ncbi:pyridoxal 5'-phosphate synthase glutaminase subunit PdxT [Treponema sp.]|uniref:pyridoxal 5'-phosphate synthase glutaminase subunit PdxT n=1 Tax=Treponema sp. TaxID=166 RepID=UPI0025E4A519|nr:pyridoxal 5'-phosphate synthase glutaminase subunit PdxT [Treponema sp.]MCR5217444.1 pyridoxal 5'-phosphate synthase glutaminase subunit PdxT [Treponema sp.]
MKNIGILSLQGAFIEHKKILTELGCNCIELRQKKDLSNLDGIVLPGGESTVQGKLLKDLGMFQPLKDLIQEGIPVLATCAGLILLARHIQDDSTTHFATLPVTVKRNAYGRQTGSFKTIQDFKNLGSTEMTFIRAPSIEEVQDQVAILASYNNKPVAVQYKKQLALAFHPELDADKKIHRYFIDML